MKTNTQKKREKRRDISVEESTMMWHDVRLLIIQNFEVQKLHTEDNYILY